MYQAGSRPSRSAAEPACISAVLISCLLGWPPGVRFAGARVCQGNSANAGIDQPIQSVREPACNLTVMLVEGDTVNQIVMRAVLRELGVEVLTADSGKQALELLEQQAIDLVLMDCHMPEMDGVAATRHGRDKEARLRRRSLPVIGLTGDVYSGAREACLEAGADDCRPQRPAPRLGRYSPAGRPGLEPPDPVARRMKGVNSRPWDRLIVTSRHVTRLPVGNGRQAKPVRHR